LVARLPAVLRARRRLSGPRIARTGAVVDTMVPTVLEQKFQCIAARRSYVRLVRLLGEPAPGPAPLLLPPAPERLAALPYHAFHPLGVERRRADTVRLVARSARRLEEAAAMEPAAAR